MIGAVIPAQHGPGDCDGWGCIAQAAAGRIEISDVVDMVEQGSHRAFQGDDPGHGLGDVGLSDHRVAASA